MARSGLSTVSRGWATDPEESETIGMATYYGYTSSISTTMGTTAVTGASSRSPDVTLTSTGNNQYASEPTIGFAGGRGLGSTALLVEPDSYQSSLRLTHLGVGLGMAALGVGEIALGVIVAFNPDKPPRNPLARDAIVIDSVLLGAALLTYGGWNIAQAFSSNPSKSYLPGFCAWGICI